MSHPRYRQIGSKEIIAIEEAIEVAQECLKLAKILCKIDRFGIFDSPAAHGAKGGNVPNWQMLKAEIADLRHALKELEKIIKPLEMRRP